MEKRRNLQMERMTAAAKEQLRKMPIDEIINNSGVRCTGDVIEIDSMGETLRLQLSDFEFEKKLEMWHHLTLLQYLFTADGKALSGNWIPLEAMPGGLSRGRGFNKDISLMFERNFRTTSSEAFMALCERLGGCPTEQHADASVVIKYAPRFPVLINFWEGDDEFPCSGKVLVDANAHHYLTMEGAGGACSAVVQRLLSVAQL